MQLPSLFPESSCAKAQPRLRIKIGAIQDQFIHTLRTRERKDKSGDTTVGKAQDIRPENAVLIHEIFQVLRKLLEGKRSGTARRFALAARIDSDYAIFFREILQLMPKAAAIFAVAMQKNQRIAVTLLTIIKLDIHKPSP